MSLRTYHVIKKAGSVHKELERNKLDKNAKFCFSLMKNRIHQVAHFYNKLWK
jgi:ribosomal protein S15P/S13E